MKDFAKQYDGKKVLVVGAAGHVGSTLIPALLKARAEVAGLYHTKPETVSEEVTAHVADISKPHIWTDVLSGIDVVFFLAAHESSQFEPELDLSVNAVSVLHMLEEMHVNNLSPKIVFASSSNLVGAPQKMPVNENTPDNPLTIYAIHKLLAEKYLELYSREFNIPSITLRLANVYGPGADTASTLHSTLNKMTRNAVLGNPLKLFSNKDKTRDFLYIDDAVKAFLAAGVVENPKGEKYVVGSEKGDTFSNIVNLLADVVSQHSPARPNIEIDSDTVIKPVEMRDFVADSAAFKQLTGWNAQTDFQTGILNTIEYFKTHAA